MEIWILKLDAYFTSTFTELLMINNSNKNCISQLRS
jgi:hypothetical protein